MIHGKNEWDDIAKYWDLFSENRVIDIPFWTACAKRFGSPILEFSCGTGRITFPLVRAGATVVGFDISRPMLTEARKKLRKEPESVRRRITLLHANANAFRIKQKQFAAIFCPWGFPPVSPEEQASLLQSVKNHLRPNGYFVVDEYNFAEPKDDWKSYYIKDFRKIPDKKMTVVRQVQHWGSAKTKIGHFLYLWDIIQASGSVKRIVTERRERMYTRRDLIHLLEAHGFGITEVYGNYDFSRWSARSERTIVVAQFGKSRQRHPLDWLRRLNISW